MLPSVGVASGKVGTNEAILSSLFNHQPWYLKNSPVYTGLFKQIANWHSSLCQSFVANLPSIFFCQLLNGYLGSTDQVTFTCSLYTLLTAQHSPNCQHICSHFWPQQLLALFTQFREVCLPCLSDWQLPYDTVFSLSLSLSPGHYCQYWTNCVLCPPLPVLNTLCPVYTTACIEHTVSCVHYCLSTVPCVLFLLSCVHYCCLLSAQDTSMAFCPIQD